MGHWTFIDFLNASECSFRNEDDIKKCDFVGCFKCMKYYSASKINKYIDDTAHCYLCDSDSIIGNRSDYPIHDISFLQHMNWYGFCHIRQNNGLIIPIIESKCNFCNNPSKYKIKKFTILNHVDPFIMNGVTFNNEYLLFTIKFNLLVVKVDNKVIYKEIIKEHEDINYDISLCDIVKIETHYFCEFP